MKKIFLTLLVFFISVNTGFGFAKKDGGDCKSCHKLSNEEATKILRQLDSNIKVEKVNYSPLGGIYELIVKDNKSKVGVVYLDFSKRHLIIGNIIDIAEKKNITQDVLEDKKVVDVSKISLKNSLIMGNKNGTKKLYVFSDPECPYCIKLHEELEKLIKEDSQLTVYIILFGLEMHPNAGWKTETILCKSKENMDEAVALLEKNYKGMEIPKVNCGKNYAEENKKLAKNLNINGTPTIILSNGKVITGYRKKNEIKKLINSK